MKKYLLFAVLPAFLLGACTQAGSAQEVVSNTQAQLVSQVDPTQVPYAELNSSVVQSGNGIVATIESECGCYVPWALDMGVLVVRDEIQIIHVTNTKALINLGAFEDSGLFVVYPGDVVYFGEVHKVSTMVTDHSMLTVTSWFDQGNWEWVALSGGSLTNPVQAKMDPVTRATWFYYVDLESFPSSSEAVNFVTK